MKVKADPSLRVIEILCEALAGALTQLARTDGLLRQVAELDGDPRLREAADPEAVDGYVIEGQTLVHQAREFVKGRRG